MKHMFTVVFTVLAALALGGNGVSTRVGTTNIGGRSTIEYGCASNIGSRNTVEWGRASNIGNRCSNIGSRVIQDIT